METKKSSKANLEKKKGIFFETGLVLALGVLLCAFSYKVNTKMEEAFITPPEGLVDEEIIPITPSMLKPPPPPPPAPKLTELIEIVEDDSEIEDNLEIEDMEADVENVDAKSFNWTGEAGDIYGPEEGEGDIFRIVEEMPKFPGDVNTWLAKNTRYPMIALENGIQGKVFVEFVIEKDGSITNVRVLRSVDPSLDKEAIRVVSSMPKWKPGKQRGKAIRVSYTVPINFKLQ